MNDDINNNLFLKIFLRGFGMVLFILTFLILNMVISGEGNVILNIIIMAVAFLCGLYLTFGSIKTIAEHW